jgi:Kef-type K+ transport system membrane component KefB
LLAIVVAVAKAAGWLSLRFGQPAVLGELLAGVAFGPSIFALLTRPPFDSPMTHSAVFHMANLGVILLMFIAGLETKVEDMQRVERAAVSVGVAGAIAPLVLGLAVTFSFGLGWRESIFMGIILMATSVSITVQTLIELGQLHSTEGLTLLGAAVVDDIVALLVLSTFMAIASTGSVGVALPLVLFRMAGFLAVAIFAGRLLRRGLARADQAPVSEGLLAFTIVTLLLYAWAAEALGGLAAITGAYVAGLLVARAGFREKIEERLRAPTYGLFVPVFFVSIGLQTNASGLSLRDAPLAILLVAAAVAGKVVGCAAGARLAGLNRAQAARVGVGMISRGEVGLIIASLGLQTGLLPSDVFAIVVIMVLATTVLTPPLLRMAFGRQPPTEEAALEAAFECDHE